MNRMGRRDPKARKDSRGLRRVVRIVGVVRIARAVRTLGVARIVGGRRNRKDRKGW